MKGWLVSRRRWPWALAVLVSLSLALAGEALPRVYVDENIAIRSALVDLESRTLHFGDVLSLVVQVEFNPAEVRLPELTSDLFASSWPESAGAHLIENGANLDSSAERDSGKRRVRYDFQILSCPNGARSCRGTKVYELPEFQLSYELLDGSEDVEDSGSVTFTPWPGALRVSSALALLEELEGFSTYFPAGGHPEPLTASDERERSAAVIFSGLILLLGGTLMTPSLFLRRWPFRARPATKRWERVLEQLRAGEFEGEERFYDELRRAFVWYCMDELKVDPFDWLKRSDSEPAEGTEGEATEQRRLFIEILRTPPGEGEQLLGRFERFVRGRS